MNLVTLLAYALFADDVQDTSLAELRRLVEKLAAEDLDERARAASKLREIGQASLPALREVAEQSKGEAAARARDLIRVIEIDPSVTERLRRTIPQASERLAAGEWKKVFFEATLRGHDWKPRHPDLTAQDLDFLAVPALRDADTEDESRDVSYGIARWGLRSAVPELVRRLKHPNPEIRETTAWTLKGLGAGEAATELARLLDDPYPGVRGAAAMALGETGNVKWVPKIAPLLKDRGHTPKGVLILEEPGMGVHDLAAASLCLLNDPRGVPHILQDPDVARHSLECLNALGQRDTWRRLAETPVTGKIRGSRQEVCATLALQARIPLELKEADSPEAKKWLSEEVLLEEADDTRSIWRGLLSLGVEGSPCSLILEPDRIRVLDRSKAVGYWKAWWSKRDR